MRSVTLIFPIRLETDEVLLGQKKTGFGQGKLVGVGGGLEPFETPEAAAQRELREETGLEVDIKDLLPRGQLDFLFAARPDWNMRAHLFAAHRWQGEPLESDELRPEWQQVTDLPWTRLWADGPHWLPQVLRGEAVHAEILYAPDNRRVERFTWLEAPEDS